MSNGIDFVIGGKDNAKPAMAAVEQSLQRLEAKTESLASSTKLLTSITGGLALAYGAVRGAMALLGGLDKINAAYDESAEAVKGLETALRLQGASVETESARLQEFASSMQSLVGAEDDATLAMMKQASMMGVATEDLDDMAKAAIGLGEAMGTSAESGMEMMRRAQEGNFMAFQKQFPAMRAMTSDTEKLAFVTELAAKGLEAKADASNRVAGMGERANNALGDLMESVGALLAPVRILISAGITTLAESLSELLVPAVEYAENILANIGPVMDSVKSAIVAAINEIIYWFTFFEVIFTNLDSVWLLIESRTELAMRQIGETIMHAVVEVIPGYVMWFGQNIINLFRDAFNGVVAIVGNATGMIVDVIGELWVFIFEDMGSGSAALGERIGAILASGLTTGFESSLTDLPDIAARTISDREKQLAETIGTVGANLGQEFADKFAERAVGMSADVAGELDKNIDLKMNAIDAATGSGASKRKDGTVGSSINAMESRLLTRGPGSQMSVPQLLERVINKLGAIADKPGLQNDNAANINAIKNAAQAAAKNKAVVVPVK